MWRSQWGAHATGLPRCSPPAHLQALIRLPLGLLLQSHGPRKPAFPEPCGGDSGFTACCQVRDASYSVACGSRSSSDPSLSCSPPHPPCDALLVSGLNRTDQSHPASATGPALGWVQRSRERGVITPGVLDARRGGLGSPTGETAGAPHSRGKPSFEAEIKS